MLLGMQKWTFRCLKQQELLFDVGNGREKAKKQASYVTKPVSEDGIEYALKHFKII